MTGKVAVEDKIQDSRASDMLDTQVHHPDPGVKNAYPRAGNLDDIVVHRLQHNLKTVSILLMEYVYTMFYALASGGVNSRENNMRIL